MPQNLLAIHGVLGLICAVGEDGKIMHFRGDIYHGEAVASPTTANLTAVHAFSPTCAYAVGDRGTVLRWDGTAWTALTIASPLDNLTAIWGAHEGDFWIGGDGVLIQRVDGASTVTRTPNNVAAIWGSGPDDVWLLCESRSALHWNGTTCHLYDLPGDEDEEYFALTGGAVDEAVWIGGMSGLVLRGDAEVWEEIDAKTESSISGIVALTEEDVWVTTDLGHLRHFNGGGWRTEAFSAFGFLSGVCAVGGTIWACGAGGVVLQHRPDDGGNKE